MAATLPGPPKEDSGAAPRGLARGQHQQRPIHQQAASRSGPFRPEAVGGTILIGTASAAGSPVSGAVGGTRAKAGGVTYRVAREVHARKEGKTHLTAVIQLWNMECLLKKCVI